MIASFERLFLGFWIFVWLKEIRRLTIISRIADPDFVYQSYFRTQLNYIWLRANTSSNSHTWGEFCTMSLEKIFISLQTLHIVSSFFVRRSSDLSAYPNTRFDEVVRRNWSLPRMKDSIRKPLEYGTSAQLYYNAITPLVILPHRFQDARLGKQKITGHVQVGIRYFKGE